MEVEYTDPVAHALLSLQLSLADENPHLTYETQVLRILRQLTEQHFRLSWTGLMSTLKQTQCVLDSRLHAMLRELWDMRTKPASLEDCHWMERVMGRDYVKPNDLIKVSSILGKVLPDKRKLYAFFACDGFLGLDLKNYVDAFKSEEPMMSLHWLGVRELYGKLNNPNDVRKKLKAIYAGEESEYSEMYRAVVGDCVYEIGNVRKQAREKWKKKLAESKKEKSNKRKTAEVEPVENQ